MLNEPLSPGQQLDHYRIEGVVARSPMATIFRAIDLRTNQQVALKVPHPELEKDSTFADRFRREEEIGRDLHHPGLIKLIADSDRNHTFIVMEWFAGKPLRQIMSEEKCTVERATRIVSPSAKRSNIFTTMESCTGICDRSTFWSMSTITSS
jgi:eukaryotic-like serine/threonine-protein kinase